MVERLKRNTWLFNGGEAQVARLGWGGGSREGWLTLRRSDWRSSWKVRRCSQLDGLN